MNKADLIIAILASSGGLSFTPVQLQKAAFLISENLPNIVDQEAGFAFAPYDYGPFDADVYQQAEGLKRSGYAEVSPAPNGRWKVYSATHTGVEKGAAVLNSLTPEAMDYVQQVSSWVRSQSFASLVKSIYEAYPSMKVNSVFQG